MLNLENGKSVGEDLGCPEEKEMSEDIANNIGKESINKDADRGGEYDTAFCFLGVFNRYIMNVRGKYRVCIRNAYKIADFIMPKSNKGCMK